MCCPKYFELVGEYGSEKAFKYHSSMYGEYIRAYANNTLEYAMNIITESGTIHQYYAAIGRGSGRCIEFELLSGV
jgi:hypothetical protein